MAIKIEIEKAGENRVKIKKDGKTDNYPAMYQVHVSGNSPDQIIMTSDAHHVAQSQSFKYNECKINGAVPSSAENAVNLLSAFVSLGFKSAGGSALPTIEEGLWTLKVNGRDWPGNFTGLYTKIGRLVTVSFYGDTMETLNLIELGGLPYPMSQFQGDWGVGFVLSLSGARTEGGKLEFLGCPTLWVGSGSAYPPYLDAGYIYDVVDSGRPLIMYPFAEEVYHSVTISFSFSYLTD